MYNYGIAFNFLSTLLLLVLHFDGSLRLPSGSGPSATTTTGIAPSSLAPPPPPFATCSSAIFDEVSEDIIALAAKEVHSSSIIGRQIITSADVEYEGLLLGLNGLLEMFQRFPELTTGTHSERDVSDTVSSCSSRNVIIRGDCKTVVDQFKGKSIPRKLKFHHEACMQVLEQLEKSHNVTFSFQHVGREYNQLCDGMCKVMLLHLQDRVTNDALNLIQTIEMNYIPLTLPKNKKKRMNHIETPFGQAIDRISNLNGRISIFMRLHLLCEIYHASKGVGDQVAMRLVGMTMYEESKRLKKYQTNEQGDSIVYHNLGLIGKKIWNDSLLAMDLDQEAQKLQRLARVEFGNGFLMAVDDEVKDLQNYLQLNLEQRDMVDDTLKDLASNEEEYQKMSEWNDHVCRMVKHSNPGEKYPCWIFHTRESTHDIH